MAGAIIPRKKRKLKSEINVVPYIDVMLVLLVIFMVTAPMLTLAVDVDLPKTNAKSVDSKVDPIIVQIDNDGRYFLKLQDSDREQLSPDALKAKVAVFVSQNRDVPVFVAAPGDADYQRVLSAMVLLQQAGVPKVGLMSQPGNAAK